jgi:hypothetical protein
MKRLAISAFLGFLLPFLYAVVVGPLSPYFKDNRTLNFYAMVPIRWPLIILEHFMVFPESAVAAVLLIVGGNVLLYGSLTYFVLFALSKRKRTIQLPPSAVKLD